jgi:zinc transporter, ZIP family
MTGTLWYAIIGGLISFTSTAGGALLSYGKFEGLKFLKIKFSIDFALGLMLSAVAFSLVGPTTAQILNRPLLLTMSMAGFVFGGLIIYSLKGVIERYQQARLTSSTQLLLALALIVHNFPEGMASGAALAGLGLSASSSILMSISLQNIPEGLLMVLCLKSMGWSQRKAFLGGLVSGGVELLGGVGAGLALSFTQEVLPVLLMLAGGAMFTSVAIELKEKGHVLNHVRKPEFALGILTIPALNILMIL